MLQSLGKLVHKHGPSCYLQNYKLLESRQGKIKTFKYMLNKSSPKTNPWGTLLINSFHELRDVFVNFDSVSSLRKVTKKKF